MKQYAGIMFCCAALFCGGAGHAAELLGSPFPEIRKNFNRLLMTNTCPGCDLRGAVLNRIDLFGADLSGADLSSAQLGQACLAGANLRNAKLREAWLGGTDLSGADLTGADMEGANFTMNSGSQGMAADENTIGRRATASAVATVNNALNSLFTQLGQQSEDAEPPEKIIPETPPPAVQSRRSVDDIPVIEPTGQLSPKQLAKPKFWERIWLERTEKEKRESEGGRTAPVDGSRQHVEPERAGELVEASPPDDDLSATVAAQPPQKAVR